MTDHSVFNFIGHVVIDSLWQGTLIAIVLAVLLKGVIRDRVSLRYMVSLAALAIIAGLPVLSLTQASGSNSPDETDLAPSYLESTAPGVDTPGTGKEGVAMPSPPRGESAWPGIAWLTRTSNGYVMYFLGIGWLVGVLGMAVRLGVGWVRVNRLRTRDVHPVNDALQETVARMVERMQVQQRVILLQSARVTESLLVGWVKPAILLPVSIVTELSTDHLEAIIAHELAHVKRYDHLVAGLQAVIEALMFYHPAVWWVSRQVRIEREHCCDDLAVRFINNKTQYVRALYELESRRPAFGTYALSVHDGSLLSRIRRLLEPGRAQRSFMQPAWSWLLVVVVLSAGLFVGSCTDSTVDVDNPVAIGEGYELPGELQDLIEQDDGEGTIAYLHERREAGDPSILPLTRAAYAHTLDRSSLRRNLVFVFAHINTMEADQVLVQIAESDPLAVVRENAVRAISLRIKKVPSVLDSRANAARIQLEELYQYPEMSEEQEHALTPALQRIALDNEQAARVRMTAVSSLAYRIDLSGFFETVATSGEDLQVQMIATRNVRPRDRSAEIMLSLYERAEDDGMKRRLLSETGFTGSLKALPFLIDHALQADDKENSWLAVDALSTLHWHMAESQHALFFADLKKAIDAKLREMKPLTNRVFTSDEKRVVARYRAEHLVNVLGDLGKRFNMEFSLVEQQQEADVILNGLSDWLGRPPTFDEPLAVFEATSTTGVYDATGITASKSLVELYEHGEGWNYIARKLGGRIVRTSIVEGTEYSRYEYTAYMQEAFWDIEIRALAPYKFGVMAMRRLDPEEVTPAMAERALAPVDSMIINRVRLGQGSS